MTRLDKIAILQKREDLKSSIDLFTCTGDEIDYLYQMTEKETKGIPRSAADWVYINNLSEKQAREKMKPVSKWNN